MNAAPSLCAETLRAIEADPLVLPPALEAHAAACPACSEARVAWLAMEETPIVLAPAGYFDRLPGRVLGKLPPARPTRQRPLLLWALAAGLIAAVGTGGFLLGHASKEPISQANLAPAATPSDQDLPASLPEAPFQEGEEVVTELHKLAPEEAQAVIDKADTKGGKP